MTSLAEVKERWEEAELVPLRQQVEAYRIDNQRLAELVDELRNAPLDDVDDLRHDLRNAENDVVLLQENRAKLLQEITDHERVREIFTRRINNIVHELTSINEELEREQV